MKWCPYFSRTAGSLQSSPVTVPRQSAAPQRHSREYSPQRAYDEWLSICDAIVEFGGDAIYQFEEADDPFLDVPELHVTGDGSVVPAGSRDALGHVDNILTGRVFHRRYKSEAEEVRLEHLPADNMIRLRRPVSISARFGPLPVSKP